MAPRELRGNWSLAEPGLDSKHSEFRSSQCLSFPDVEKKMLEIYAHRPEYFCHWNLSALSFSCSVLLSYQFSTSGFLCLRMRGQSRRDPYALEHTDHWGTLMWTFTLHVFTECLMCARHCVRPWKLSGEHNKHSPWTEGVNSSVRWQQILQEWDSTSCSDAH